MKLFAASLFLLLPFCVISQISESKNFSLEKGVPYKVLDAERRYFLSEEENLVAVKKFKDEKESHIQYFDRSSLKLLKTVVLKEGIHLEKYIEEERIYSGGGLYTLYSKWNETIEREEIFYERIDLSNPVESDTVIRILNTPKAFSRYGYNKIDVCQSVDKSKVLITYKVYPGVHKKKSTYYKVGFAVFDDSLNEIWKGDFEMPVVAADLKVLDYTVDSQGIVYLTSRVRNGEEVSMQLHVFSEGKEPKTHKVKVQGKRFPAGLKIEETKLGEVYCLGFFGTGDKKFLKRLSNTEKSISNGLYYAQISEGELINDNKIEISVELINSFIREKERKSNLKKLAKGEQIGIEFLEIQKAVVQEDGGLLVISEGYHFTSPSDPKFPSYKTFSDLLLAKIDTEGNLIWMKKIPKNQQSYGGYGYISYGFNKYYTSDRGLIDMSYRYMSDGSNHYFLFVDHIDNLNLAESKAPQVHGATAGGYFTACKINDKTGEVSFETLFQMKDIDGFNIDQVTTNSMFQSIDDELIIEAYKKDKENILLRLKLK